MKNIFHDMKKITAVLACLLATALFADAQTEQKKVRPFIELGAGLSYVTNNGYDESVTGMGLSLSGGLDIRVNDKWSISPSVGHIDMIGDAWYFFRGYIGADYDCVSMFDCSLLASYHFISEGAGYVFGLGPALFLTNGDERYYIDADPSDPRAGLKKNHKTDIGIRMSFAREFGKHWYLGVQANAGLRNMMIQYPDCGIDGSKHLFTALFTAGFKF